MLNFFHRCIDLIGDKFNILILSPNFRSFGNCTEEIFFGLLHCLDKNKKLLLLKPFDQVAFKKVSISNKYLYQLEHELIVKKSLLSNFFTSLIMTLFIVVFFIISNLRKLFAKIYNLPKEFYSSKEISSSLSLHFGKRNLWGFSENKIYSKEEWNELEKRFAPLEIPQSIKETSNSFIKEYAEEAIGKKWVTLHVLDNTKANYARGADIKAYYPVIEYLIDSGFHIFRIGDVSMPKSKSFHGLTDLAHIEHDNSLDLFLIYNAEFHIGVGSGPNYATYLFNTDLLATNLTEWSTSLPRKKGNFFITKKIFSKSTKKRIPISELFQQNFNFQINTNEVLNNDIYTEDNSSEELVEAVKDYITFKQRNEDYSTIQKKFDESKNLWLQKELLLQKELKIHYSPKDQYAIQRIRSIALSSVKGTMANSFLKENWE